MTNRYSVTVSITLEIDAESESDARAAAFEEITDGSGFIKKSSVWVDSVSKCEEGE